MPIIILILCLVAAWLGYKREKNIYNPLTAFYIFWASIVALASLRLYGLQGASSRTWNVIFLGLLSFVVFYYLTDNRRVWEKKREKKYEFNYKILYFFCIITIIYLLIDTIEIVKILNRGYNMKDIRGMYYDAESALFGSSLKYIYRTYVNRPIVHIMPPIAIVDFIAGKRDKKILIMTIIIVFLFTIINGGRFILYYILIHLFVSLLMFKNKIRLNKVSKLLISSTVVLIIAGIVIISIQRQVKGPLKYLYTYITGCIPHLDYRLNMVDQHGIFTYGLSTFYGIIQPILFFIKNIGIIEYPQFYLQSVELANVQDYINVGTNLRFNAFVTPFFYFYLDKGLLGVFLGSGLYGIITSIIYKLHKDNLRFTILYLLILQGLLSSMVRFPFVISSYVIAIIMVFLVTKNVSIKNNFYYRYNN